MATDINIGATSCRPRYWIRMVQIASEK